MTLRQQFTAMVLGVFLTAMIILSTTVLLGRYIVRDTNLMEYSRYRQKAISTFMNLETLDPQTQSDMQEPPANVMFILVDDDGNVIFDSMDYFDTSLFIQMFSLIQTKDDLIAATKSMADKQVFIEVVHNEQIHTSLILVWMDQQDQSSWFPIWYFPILLFLFIFVLSALFSTLFLRKTNQTISRLVEATRKISEGDLEFHFAMDSGTREFMSLAQSFETMRSQLKEERTRRSFFLMAVSHDLKTPLTTIEGYLEAINDGVIQDDEKKKKYLKTISQKAKVLESRIIDLIDFVKMETGEWKLKGETINLKEFFDRTAEEFQDEAYVLDRVFQYNSSLSGSENVQGDEELLTRVFENLLSNAFRYTSKGDRISITCDRRESSVLIDIVDTGPGIDKEQIDLIFDPFYRGTRSRREQGFGLGLSIVKSILEAHQWKITVTSDKGTRFTIEIPMEQKT